MARRGQWFRLGPPVGFVAVDLTFEEWRWRLKGISADGGHRPTVRKMHFSERFEKFESW